MTKESKNFATSTIRPTLTELDDDLVVCIADADTRAVLGAKTSRARDIRVRWPGIADDGEEMVWGRPSESVQQFLDINLDGYGHASIADMSETWVHLRNIGWPMAWLIEDTPLFTGQEVSTRAVHVARDTKMCSGAPEMLAPLHEQWLEKFLELRMEAGDAGGYKFDEYRWALPGTTRLGVTSTMTVRNSMRHFEMIEGMGDEYAVSARKMIEGVQFYAPRTAAAVRKGPREPSSTWGNRKLNVLAIESAPFKSKRRAVDIHYTAYPFDGEIIRAPGRDAPRTHLDSIWKDLGAFRTTIRCSVAAARDWHRHRPLMPWRINVPVEQRTGLLFPSPDYDMGDVDRSELWKQTSEAFLSLCESDQPWDAMYALPFGAMVEIQCTASLPDLLYMLELRAYADGANFEYARQAKRGLAALYKVLAPDVRKKIKLEDPYA